MPDPRPTSLHRFVAVVACTVFAVFGGLVICVKLFGSTVSGDWTPPPQPAEAREILEEGGVTTRTEPLFALEREGKDDVTVGARLSHHQVERGERVEVAAAVGVQTWGERSQARPPVELALVFDVSGSMMGEPLRDVKTAANALLEQLDEGDRVALVAYSTDAWVVAPLTYVTPQNRHELQAHIDRLETGGSTNIDAGWNTGRAQLSDGEEGLLQRVMLLSDGQANHGNTSIDALGTMASAAMELGVTTTTFGVGLDYNEDLLQRMARRGGGNYHFVYGDRAARAFDDEVHSLLGTVTSRAQLRVETAPSLEVESIEGYDWRPTATGVEVELGSLAVNTRRDVLVEFRPTTVVQPIEFTFELSWRDEATGEAMTKRWSEVVRIGDESSYDALILTRLQKIRTARALTEATRKYERGDRESAANLLEKMIRQNESFADNLGVDDEALSGANAALGRLADDIRSYDPYSNQGKFLIKGSKFKSSNVAVDSSVTF